MRFFNEYQFDAMDLRLGSAMDPNYVLLGLPGEVGEVCSIAAKAIRYGRLPDHRASMLKELGDCLWFIAAIAEDNDLTLQDIADANIKKLRDRRARGVLQGSGDNR